MRGRLGDDIDDFCVKCKRVMNHLVVSLLNDEPAKVRCRTCHGDHDFRHEQAPPPKIDARKAALIQAALEKAAAATGDGAAAPAEVVVEEAVAADPGKAGAKEREGEVTIFVTGGAGFIGSEFIRQMAGSAKIVNFDKLTYAGNLDNLTEASRAAGYSLVRGDVCDAQAVYDAMPEGCDAVVHFAAESHVDRSIAGAEEFVRTNVLGTQVMLDVSRRRGAGKFLHISTDEVGGDMPPGGWFKEDDPLQGNSPYAASKAGAELLVRAAARTHGMNTLITRTSNNYGPYQFPEKLLPLAISNVLEDRPIPVYGDGLQVRDWVHVTDNCRALRAVLERGRAGETYHIGGGDPLPNIEVLRTLLRILGKPESMMTRVTDRPGHDRRYAVDFSKTTRELGWKPEISFADGLAATIQWYRDNAEWVRRCRSGEYRTYYEAMYGDREATAQVL